MFKIFFYFYVVTISFFIIGCKNSIIVETTKPWENHYYTIKDFEKNTQNIQLDTNESIWVLSNTTLARLLKNTGKIK